MRGNGEESEDRRIRDIVPLRRLLGDVPKALGVEKQWAEGQAVALWSEVVGRELAERTRALRVDAGVLIVAVEDDPWRQELTMQRGWIMAAYRARFVKMPITDVRFVGRRDA